MGCSCRLTGLKCREEDPSPQHSRTSSEVPSKMWFSVVEVVVAQLTNYMSVYLTINSINCHQTELTLVTDPSRIL